GGLVLPLGTSDVATQVWDWVLADPEAAAWLAGAPDEWGMTVNPVYATDADVSPFDSPFGTPLPSSFPKSDPYCFQEEPLPGGVIIPPQLCGTDWVPYATEIQEAARIGRTASPDARIVLDVFARSTSDVWDRESPQPLGSRGMLVLTDVPSARLFGLQVAALSRAGDNDDDRVFIQPDDDGLTAGVATMVASDTPGVYVPDPLADAPDAYPLTALSHAAVAPARLDDEARDDFGAFLRYAAEGGQSLGFGLGELPVGYAELPASMRLQIVELADRVENYSPPSTTTTTTTTTTVPSSSSGSSGSGSGGSSTPPPTTTTTTTTTTVPTTTTTATTTTTVPDVLGAVEDAEPEPVFTADPSTPAGRWAVPILGSLFPLSAYAALSIHKRPRYELTLEES
ncbi:MAG: hypothetical protein AAF081_18175, partial [Actinomycetota bacterium]